MSLTASKFQRQIGALAHAHNNDRAQQGIISDINSSCGSGNIFGAIASGVSCGDRPTMATASELG
jgi:hypothetical protein